MCLDRVQLGWKNLVRQKMIKVLQALSSNLMSHYFGNHVTGSHSLNIRGSITWKSISASCKSFQALHFSKKMLQNTIYLDLILFV